MPEASRPAMPFGSAAKTGKPAIPTRRQLAPLHQVDLVREFWMLGAVGGEQLGPIAPSLRAARAYPGGEMLAHGVRDEELGVLRPSVAALGEANLVVAQRLAMSGGSVVLVRRAVADVAVENDEGRAALGHLERVQCGLDAVDVIGVGDAKNVPVRNPEIWRRCPR